ncbi:MAG: acetylxylan esterase [Solirubrobacterales bacterium]
MRKLVGLSAMLAALVLAPQAHATISSVFEGELSCTVQGDGVRFCGSSSPRSTVETFDGVPIDVNVAFPPAPPSGPDGGYPLVMMFHGYGGSKASLDSMHRWLDRGYATFSMTDRGFNESCGNAASVAAEPTACAPGYIRLMDERYEVRDAQDFAGRLADEGLVSPTQIAAIGGSYGGGMSMALAALKDRQMMLDGSLVPWKSPEGTPMSLAAAAPEVPWTDLAYALTPNGSTLDYVANAPYRGRLGVYKSSFVTGLYLVGCAVKGRCATPGSDPEADLTGWNTRLNAGEPYEGDPSVTSILDELKAHHSSYYVDRSEPPAPLLISNGWTDDLFPPDEAIRFYNRTKTQYPKTPVSLYFMDFGHMRGQNKAADVSLLAAREEAWFDFYLKGEGSAPFQGIETLTQTCPGTDPSGGPYFAKDWAHVSKGEVRLSAAAPKSILPGAGDPSIGATFDPVSGPGACAQAAGDDQAGTATYRLPAAKGAGYTLLGSPTVRADFKLTDTNSQVAARLLDVGPDGKETLVARGLWRPKTAPGFVNQVFQLHPNGWHFAAGHVAKLELLPSDPPYGRASNGQKRVTVRNLRLTLPVLERPGAVGGTVKAPSPKLVPKGYALASQFKGFGEARAKLLGKVAISGSRAKLEIGCPGSFETCHKGRVRVVGDPKRGSEGRGLIARGTFTLDGGKSKVLGLPLTRRGRDYFAASDSLRVEVSVSSAETVGAGVQTTSAGR